MKCLLFVFSFCIIARFINGQEEDKVNSPGKELSNLDGNRGVPVFRRQPAEESSNEKLDNIQEELESNVEDSTSNEADNIPLTGNDNKKLLEVIRRSPVLVYETKCPTKGCIKMAQETLKMFASEMAAADPADLMGHNEHFKQSSKYNDLGRRFVPQYKYSEAHSKEQANQDDNEPIPEKAPAELVLVVAKESAMLGPDKSGDPDTDLKRKQILRTGDYWNGVWKEEVAPKTSLRTDRKKVLGAIKAKIKPGSEFYQVVQRMKKISPRLLYIINKRQ